MALRGVSDILDGFDDPKDDFDPMALLATNDEEIIVPLNFDKKQWGNVLTEIAKTVNANAAAVINSCWMVIRSDDDKDDDKPPPSEEVVRDEIRRVGGISNLPDRIEGVLVFALDADGVLMRKADMHRTNDAPPTLDEFEDWGEGGEFYLYEPLIKYFEGKE